jgi:ribonuclease P protein component
VLSAECFPKTARLLKARDFDAVFKKRQYRAWSSAGTLLAMENRQVSARLGLVVSKKSLRRATARNTLKRIVREGFRQRQHQLAGLDIVFVSSRQLAHIELDKATLHQHMDDLWRHLLKKRQSRKKRDAAPQPSPD